MFVNGIDLHREFVYHGKTLALDAAYIDSDTIEVMLMDKANPAIEYERRRTSDPEKAERIYNEIRYNYADQPYAALSGKYAQLRDDLKKALKAAEESDTPEDGGTCNFDAPSIVAPRWIQKKVIQAAKEAGTTAYKWDCFGETKYVFGVPGGGQASRRTRKAEAMLDCLTKLGYETLMYCSID